MPNPASYHRRTRLTDVRIQCEVDFSDFEIWVACQRLLLRHNEFGVYGKDCMLWLIFERDRLLPQKPVMYKVPYSGDESPAGFTQTHTCDLVWKPRWLRKGYTGRLIDFYPLIPLEKWEVRRSEDHYVSVSPAMAFKT